MRGWFQEAFGCDCVDAGYVPGTAGCDIETYVARKLLKFDLWPIEKWYLQYSENDVFDLAEFLFDHVSEPVNGELHSWMECGWHYHTFNRKNGQLAFRRDLNEVLKNYGDGYELNETGEILCLAEPGMESLLSAELPKYDPKNVDEIVSNAVIKFRRHRSSVSERKEAVRSLVDVLEYLRPKLKQVLMKKDESDLFNIANNFAIRHHTEDQKSDYDESIWLSWMFYFYLATIHAAIRFLRKTE